MTACWSKGRDKHYPYYFCFTKGCEYYRKSIRKEKIEDEFEKILQNLCPSENLFSMCKKMFKQLWEHKIQMRGKDKLAIKDELKKTEEQIDKLLERVINAENQIVITAYEKQIKKLENKKFVLQEKIANSGDNLPDYDKTFRTAFLFLSNPYKLWASEKLEDKRSALKLLFTSKLSYDLKEGFRTAPIALPFKALEVLKGGENQMVRLRRFERPTTAFGGRYSIQLSYRRLVILKEELY